MNQLFNVFSYGSFIYFIDISIKIIKLSPHYLHEYYVVREKNTDCLIKYNTYITKYWLPYLQQMTGLFYIALTIDIFI